LRGGTGASKRAPCTIRAMSRRLAGPTVTFPEGLRAPRYRGAGAPSGRRDWDSSLRHLATRITIRTPKRNRATTRCTICWLAANLSTSDSYSVPVASGGAVTTEAILAAAAAKLVLLSNSSASSLRRCERACIGDPRALRANLHPSICLEPPAGSQRLGSRPDSNHWRRAIRARGRVPLGRDRQLDRELRRGG
jgi:hypothetical protein